MITFPLTVCFHVAWMFPSFILLAFLIERILYGSVPRMIHRLWLLVLPATLVLAVVATTLRPFKSYAHTIKTEVAGTTSSVTIDNRPGNVPAALSLPHLAGELILAALAVFALFAAFRLAMTVLKVRRLRRDVMPVELKPEFEQSLHRIAPALGIATPLLLESSNVHSPIVVGALNPSILLPENFFLGLELEDFNAAIAHECAHIARRDYAANLALRVLAVPFAWHPCTPLLFRFIAASREIATDRMAADTLGNPRAYAISLLNLWKQLTLPKPQLQGIGIFDANILQERIMQIVNKPNRLSISRRALIAVACLPFIALTAYATNALRLQVEEPSALKSAAASKEEQEKVKARRVVHQVNPKWPGEKSDYPDKYQTSVILGLTVDEEGVPLNVHVVKSGGAPFDASAMDAVSQYRFSPGPAVKLNMEIHFQRY